MSVAESNSNQTTDWPELKILYRGPLSSCNYDCVYCPFAKQVDSREELATDKAALDRFCDWVEQRKDQADPNRFSILFTPWGEGLTRRWYREALVRLSNSSNVNQVAIQTNLSCGLRWIERCDLSSLGLWCTWHPNQVPLERFLNRCFELDQIGASYSVGLVGIKEHMDAAIELRERLSPNVYFWINAYKREPDYYSEKEIEFWTQIDPLFETNNTRHSSAGQACRTGQSVISVDGDGDIRRCHFIKQVIGNIYQPDFENSLRARKCTNQTCGCHIGYVHMNALGLYDMFGDGVLHRVPRENIWQLESCLENSTK